MDIIPNPLVSLNINRNSKHKPAPCGFYFIYTNKGSTLLTTLGGIWYNLNANASHLRQKFRYTPHSNYTLIQTFTHR